MTWVWHFDDPTVLIGKVGNELRLNSIEVVFNRHLRQGKIWRIGIFLGIMFFA